MVVMTGFEKTGMELVYVIHGTSWHINFLLFSQRLSSSQTVRYGRCHTLENQSKFFHLVRGAKDPSLANLPSQSVQHTHTHKQQQTKEKQGHTRLQELLPNLH